MTTPLSGATAAPATATKPAGTANPTTAATAETGTEQSKQLFTNADFETFLRMLTTQLKNQDPLNPMEGSEFAVQLATFSGVEQQAYTNKLLEQLTEQGGASGLMQLSGWIGKEARTTAPVWFGATPLTLDIDPKAEADSVLLVAKDSYGRVVSREEIGPGKGQVDWFGRDQAGNKLPNGTYSFRVESWADGKQIGDSAVASFARVIGAESTTKGAKLVFEGGGSALASEVDAVREAR